MHNYQYNTNLFGNVEIFFFSTSDWRNDSFLLYHWLFWIQSNFQVTKKQKQQKEIKTFSYKEQTFVPRVFHSVSVRTLTERHKQTQSANSWLTQSTNRKARLKPLIRDAQKLLFSKSHLGWFFLVFGKGKARKENISIFWFIWPLMTGRPKGNR